MNAPFKGHERLRIAVIGSGIAGSAAAWALDPVHEVTLYEKSCRPGGHTATVDIEYGATPLSVDTGFIVYNETNYPNLTALFRHLGVATHESDMSFSLSLDGGRLEWCGDGLAGVFAQKSNLLRPAFLAMLRDILRFNRSCAADRAAGALLDMSVGDYLRWRGFSRSFADNYLMPMVAAIWSTPAHAMLDFPADRLVNFFENHRLIHARQNAWRTVTGGSRTYLEKLLSPLRDRLRLGCEVVSVRRERDMVFIRDIEGNEDEFDHVVIAAHSDQALAMLGDARTDERTLLSAIPYRANRVLLHRDPSLMPRRRRAWASWNCLRSGMGDEASGVAVTYWMNRLQGLDPRCPVFVTLNPDTEPAEDTIFGEFTYEHPQFDSAAMGAQARLGELQGRQNTWFAGAWMGYGFHEDGLSSGLAVAEALGGIVPWRTAGNGIPQRLTEAAT